MSTSKDNSSSLSRLSLPPSAPNLTQPAAHRPTSGSRLRYSVLPGHPAVGPQGDIFNPSSPDEYEGEANDPMGHSSRSPTPPDASSDAATSDDVDYVSNAPAPSFTSWRDLMNERDVSITSDYDPSVSLDRPPLGSLRYGRARSAPVGLPSAPVGLPSTPVGLPIGLPSAPDVGSTSQSLSAALFSSFKSTPLRHSTSSTLSQDHLRGMVHKALYTNLVNHAKKVTSEQWVEGVLGLDMVAFAKLHTAIHDAGWAQDQLIVDALQEITKAQKEIETYDPYCKIINYIMAHAKDLTAYPPATDHLGNLSFRPHNLKGVVKGVQEEVNAAQRFPDIVALTDSTNETHWYMIPLTCELKYTTKADNTAQRRHESVCRSACVCFGIINTVIAGLDGGIVRGQRIGRSADILGI